MINQEKFHEFEMQYGCGYWNVCWEHACPCAITTENKGLREDIYNDLVQESREVVNAYEKEFIEDDYLDFIDYYEENDSSFDEDNED